jgi:thiol:disulfide interchange protein DsbD
VKALVEQGRTVFLDFTADWCATCQANDKAFIETDAVRDALVRHRVVPMQADMTNDNEPADALLHELGRSGIPAYVVFRPDGTRDLLPELITSELVASRLAPRPRERARRDAEGMDPKSAKTPPSAPPGSSWSG